LFRHPGHVDGLIAIAGLYQPRVLSAITRTKRLLQQPAYYLPNLSDETYLDRYRRSRIVFCVGQGR